MDNYSSKLSYLADDFEYTSQWVFETLRGKEKYMEYLGGKFSSILRDATSIPTAEIAYFKKGVMRQNKPCIILSQKGNKVCIMIEIKDGKITNADLVGIPSPGLAIEFNYFPK